MRFSFLYFLAVVMMLSGCRSLMDPTPMPAGYSYHRNLYKSPPGPKAPHLTSADDSSSLNGDNP